MIDTLAVRNRILRLAFSGQLTERDNTDDSVDELLSRINPKVNIAQDSDTPYEIPASWAWVRLADLYTINPKVEADESIDAAFIPMERIDPGFEDSFTYEIQSWGKASKNHTKFQNDDVAFAKISPCFENRKSFVAKDLPNGIGGGTTELIILRQNEMFPKYTYYLVSDQRFINVGAASYKGTVGQQRVQSDVVKNYLVPVPSFSEQIRIVEKIESAFSILDIIDDYQQQYVDNVEQIRNKVIDAALHGELTEQLPEDGSSLDYLSCIEGFSEISAQEVLDKPYDLPENWTWCKFSQVVDFYLGKTPARGNKLYWTEGKYPWVSIGDMSARGYISSTKEKVSQKAYDECFSRGLSPKGTLIMSFKLSIGKVAILDIDSFHNEAIISICPRYDEDETFKNYLYWVLPTIAQNTEAHGAIKGNTLNKTSLSGMMIPIPPLQEQKRIVDAICNISEVLNS